MVRLEVTRCHFRQLNEGAIRAKDLVSLVFEENRVEHIGEHALALPGLQDGSVAFNWFKQYDPDSFPSAVGVKFLNNSFFCDCTLAWLWDNQESNAIWSSGRCWGPSSLRKLSLRQLEPSPRDNGCKELLEVSNDIVQVQSSIDSQQIGARPNGTVKPLRVRSRANGTGASVSIGFWDAVSQCTTLVVLLFYQLHGF